MKQTSCPYDQQKASRERFSSSPPILTRDPMQRMHMHMDNEFEGLR